ncbi:MAG: hypothetical protein K1000chlam2_01350 [Chlamydiae bacterium]|nr:hypothetical protein [Chlamydiota bacterium]
MGLLEAFLGGGTTPAPVPTAPVNTDQKKKPEYKTEFHQLSKEFIGDIAVLRDKYPLAVLTAVVALGFFGLLNVLSFSITNIATGSFLFLLSWSLGVSIYRKGLTFFTADIRHSVGKLLSYKTAAPAGENKPATTTSTTSSS